MGLEGAGETNRHLLEAAAVRKAAEDSGLGAYVVLCLMTGIRTEEARALRWDHVDLDAASIAVWRSVRLGGDSKTSKSRRTLGHPRPSSKRCGRIACGRRLKLAHHGNDLPEGTPPGLVKGAEVMDQIFG